MIEQLNNTNVYGESTHSREIREQESEGISAEGARLTINNWDSEKCFLSWVLSDLFGLEPKQISRLTTSAESIIKSEGDVWIGFYYQSVKDNPQARSALEDNCLLMICLTDFSTLVEGREVESWLGMFLALLVERAYKFSAGRDSPTELTLDLVSNPPEPQVVQFRVALGCDDAPFLSQDSLNREITLRTSFPPLAEGLREMLEGEAEYRQGVSAYGEVIYRTDLTMGRLLTRESDNGYEILRIPIKPSHEKDKQLIFKLGTLELDIESTELGLVVKGDSLR